MSRGKLFILSAPSGTGKSTILRKVMAHIPGLAFSISHTTRAPRQGERNGVEYHFIDRVAFAAMKDKGEFLEDADVHGNLYGTSRKGIQLQQDAGFDVVLDIDVQGADILRRTPELEAVYVFLAPPGLAELEKRLRSRGLDDEQTIARRLRNARGEMAAMERFDYIVVNERLDEAIRMFEAIILAERARGRRRFDGSPCGRTT